MVNSNFFRVGSYKYVVANMFLDPRSGTPNVNAVVDADTDGKRSLLLDP